jgi:geranylgeranyl pyrophosphate synthase
MTPKKKLMERAIAILRERGQEALEAAKKTIVQEEIEFKPLKEALCYFMDDWEDVLHPALVSLACEAVGGKPETTIQIGAALVLLAGGADVHDDIIDQSVTKGSTKTVFGKFGRDIAILVGDALILKGTYLLHEASELLPKNKRKAILNIVRQVFFEISGAEAKEATFRGKTDLSVKEYLEIIRHKVAASEASTMIGAILGNGTAKEIEILGHYGRTFGILLTVRDEFVDVFEKDEITNRAKKECLPLPIIVAFQDNSKKIEILKLLKGRITADKIEKIVDLSMDCKENREQIRKMRQMARQESLRVSTLQHHQAIFELLLKSTLEDL